MTFRKWLIARLKERSTWVGVIGFLSAVGVGLAPDQKEAFIGVGLAMASAVAAFTKDDPKGD